MRKALLTIATFVLVQILTLASCLAALTLDPNFAGSGKLTIAFPDSSTNYSSGGYRIFVQPGGRIVAGGTFSHATADGQMLGVVVVGITPGGTLDGTFATGGMTMDWQSHGATSFNDALMYPDGRVLRISRFFTVTGSSTVRTERLTADGFGDTVFASNVSIGPTSGFGTARPSQIGVRTDGKIVALILDGGQYFLYRLNPDGTRDSTFGTNGVLQIRFNKITLPDDFNMDMVIQPDGKILIVGHMPPLSFMNGSSAFFLARLTESGNWDKTFGRAGFVKSEFGPGLTGFVTRAIRQPDGKFLLCGQVNGSDSDVWMARFKPNGKPDSTFGNGGFVINDFSPGAIDVARSIALSSDGKIRLVGGMSPSSFLVARFSSSGTLEDHTAVTFTPDYAGAQDVAIQSDGKLVVVGYTRNPNMSVNGSVFAVARLTE